MTNDEYIPVYFSRDRRTAKSKRAVSFFVIRHSSFVIRHFRALRILPKNSEENHASDG